MPLRMALAAQSAGASAVQLAAEEQLSAKLLHDPRLRIPVLSETASLPEVDLIVETPWNLVVHRDTFRDIEPGRSGALNLERDLPVRQRPFGFGPVLVTDRRSARRAEGLLLTSLRKPQDGWTSTYLNRYISLFFTRWLAKTPLRPNQVSVGILLIGIAGAYLASRGTYWTMLVGALLFQAQSVLDGCDGELSRVTYRGSHLGEWLDTVGDDITNYGFFTGAAWGLYSATGSWIYLVAGAVTVTMGVVTSAIEYRYLISIGSGDLLKYPLGIGAAPSSAQGTKGPIARLLDAISPLFKRDTFVLLTLLGAMAGLLGPFLFVFAAGGVGIFVAVVNAERRMWRQRRSAA